jgi:DNA-binding transcriptional ArsR family regulator
MGEYPAPPLDRVFHALADPTRRAIVARLAGGETRITAIAAPFRLSLNSVSKHVRVLEQAGLVRRRVVGREHLCSLNPRPLHDAAAWLEHYRAFWTERLDRLAELVEGEARPERERPTRTARRRTHGRDA